MRDYEGEEVRVLKFNTGRHYTVYGQRIWAALMPDGRVVMYDHDRMLHYVLNCAFTQEDIVNAYDNCEYEDPRPEEITTGMWLEYQAKEEYNE